jgi:hypothetical protein
MLRRLTIAVAVQVAAGCTCAQLPTDIMFCPEDGGACDGGHVADGGTDAGPPPDAGCTLDCAAQMFCGTHLDSCGQPEPCPPCAAGNTCSNGVCRACTTQPDIADPPDDTFSDSDCDGIDGEVRSAVFVDPIAGDDTGDGSMDHPVKTLSRALGNAMMRGATMVLVSEGRLDADRVDWNLPISVYGGYHATRQWQRDDTRALLDAGTLALHVHSPVGVVVWDRVDVSSASAGPGGSSTAVVAENTILMLNRVTVRAGNGGPGADGTPTPGPPADGPSGNDGSDGTTDIDGGRIDLPTQGGAPALTACSDGGSGGIGASITMTSGGPAFYPGCNVLGGQSSLDQPGAHCGPAVNPPGNGFSGDDGASGSKGGDGSGGPPRGLVVGIYYQPSNGSSGQRGGDGIPGCGAGGGGSSRRSFAQASGGGGASGGAGGCGGSAGSPGHGGGGSIGLLLVDAGVTLTVVSVHTGLGGNGGSGFPGQQGGLGGRGGRGGKGGDACSPDDGGFPNGPGNAGNGGNGGDGGTGGNGGNAGGGGGGPSIGIWCIGDAHIFVDAGVVITAVDGGAGGRGGAAGLDGQNGLRHVLPDCP